MCMVSCETQLSYFTTLPTHSGPGCLWSTLIGKTGLSFLVTLSKHTLVSCCLPLVSILPRPCSISVFTQCFIFLCFLSRHSCASCHVSMPACMPDNNEQHGSKFRGPSRQLIWHWHDALPCTSLCYSPEIKCVSSPVVPVMCPAREQKQPRQ